MTRVMSRIILAALAAVLLAVAAAACGGGEDSGSSPTTANSGSSGAEPIEADPANEGKSVTVGSKNFTEQFILGEIYSQALEAGGFDVTKELNLGSEQIAHKALLDGEVDMYPEYTGTSLTSFFDFETEDVPKDPVEAYELTREEYAKEDVTALPQANYDNTFVIASTTEKAAELGDPTTISDLAENPEASEFTIAGFPECRQRTDCLLGLEDVYGWTPEFVSNEGKFEPLKNDQTDLGFVFGTDAELSLDEYATYEDDMDLFPPYYISMGVRNDALEEIGPEGQEIIERVQEPLDENVMRELNARVDLDKQEPEDVAADYLSESGFVQ